MGEAVDVDVKSNEEVHGTPKMESLARMSQWM